MADFVAVLNAALSKGFGEWSQNETTTRLKASPSGRRAPGGGTPSALPEAEAKDLETSQSLSKVLLQA
jgi:hypothetical protein